MQVTMNRRFAGKVMNDRDIDTLLLQVARPTARRIEAATPVRTGATRRSTSIETGHTNAKRDRRAVRIVQSHGAVPMNFRDRQGYMARAAKGGG